MIAGKLDRQLQFERFTTTDDGFSTVEVWATHGDPIWCEKKDISDGERWRASEVQANITTRFVVRYSTFTRDITPKDRLTFEGSTCNISGIKEVGGRRRFFEITAAAETT